MASLTKNKKIAELAKLVQKRARGTGLSRPPQRTILETLMYAALLENAVFDKADSAYAVLENYYIDWNEIRVCSVQELADTLLDLPHPEEAAVRMRKSLQSVFAKTYTFDLEDLRKKWKAIADHIKALEEMGAGTPYMIHYVAQVAMEGHLFPLDEATLRIMRRLGLTQLSSDGKKEICTGIDRVILKNAGILFSAQLHHFAAQYYDVPDSPELLKQLSAIDPEAVNRSWEPPIVAKEEQPETSAVFQPYQVSRGRGRPKSSLAKSGKKKSSKKKSGKTASPLQEEKPKKRGRKPAQPSVEIKKADKKTGKRKSKTVKSSKMLKTSKDKNVLGKKPGKTVSPLKKGPLKKGPLKKGVPKNSAIKKDAVKKGAVKGPVKNVKKSSGKPPTKPVKKVKGVSPSKTLRKQKPK